MKINYNQPQTSSSPGVLLATVPVAFYIQNRGQATLQMLSIVL